MHKILSMHDAKSWTLAKQAQNKLAAAQTKMERVMLNITYKDRKTNTWISERWTSQVPFGDNATRKVDNGDQPSSGEIYLDKYWSDKIWQRTVQDRLTWRWHVEAFSQMMMTNN